MATINNYSFEPGTIDSGSICHENQTLKDLLNNLTNKSAIEVGLTANTSFTNDISYGFTDVILDNQIFLKGNKFSFSNGKVVVNSDSEILVKISANTMINASGVNYACIFLNNEGLISGYTPDDNWSFISLVPVFKKVKKGDVISLKVGSATAKKSINVGGGIFTHLIVEEI